LREVLKRTGKVGISKVVIRSRQYLSALIPEGNALVLVILRYYQELRDSAEFEFPTGSLEDYKISEKEIEIAGMLVDTMSSEWDPKQYHDEYRVALMEYIDKKAKSGGLMPAPQEETEGREEAGKVVDMMEILKRSVERAGAIRGKRARGKEDEKAA
jgi:DNA end-binding protein Ku